MKFELSALCGAHQVFTSFTCESIVQRVPVENDTYRDVEVDPGPGPIGSEANGMIGLGGGGGIGRSPLPFPPRYIEQVPLVESPMA